MTSYGQRHLLALSRFRFGMAEKTMQADNKRMEPNTCVLITGATGFTRSVLVRKLCQSGIKVRAIGKD